MTTARRSLATALLRARSRAASSPSSYTTLRARPLQAIILQKAWYSHEQLKRLDQA